MSFAVRFDFPGATTPCFAGLHKGAWGWAPTLATAELFDTIEAAQNCLDNAYTKNSRLYGRIVTVKAGYPVGAPS